MPVFQRPRWLLTFCILNLVFADLGHGQITDQETEQQIKNAIDAFEKNASIAKKGLMRRVSAQRAVFKKTGNLEGVQLADRELRNLEGGGELPSCVQTVDYRKTITSHYEQAVSSMLQLKAKLTKKGDLKAAEQVADAENQFQSKVSIKYPGTLFMRTTWVHSVGRYEKLNAEGEWVEITDHGRKPWIEKDRNALGVVLRNIDNTVNVYLFDDRCESLGIKGKRKLVFRGQWQD